MEESGTVEALLSLQTMDREIAERREEAERLARELEAEREEVVALEQEAEAARPRLEEAEADLRRLERSVQAGRATLKRLEKRESEVQNLRQHVAMRAETEAARRNLREHEEETLDAMQAVEDARSRLEDVESRLEERRDELASRSEAVEARLAELREEIEVRRDRKQNRRVRMDSRTLRLYEMASSGRADSALAPLTQDGVCGHCFTSVPLQRQSEIRAGRTLHVCEGCGVILYAPEEG